MIIKVIQLSIINLFCLILIQSSCMITDASADVENNHLLLLTDQTVEEDLYETFYILSDNKKELTIEEVSSKQYEKKFKRPDELDLKPGFFEVAKWLKFDVRNGTDEKEWLIELAFPLIAQIHIYEKVGSEFKKIIISGADYPFDNREINHRHFVFNLNIEPNETNEYYVLLHGGGDLHPPIKLWQKNAFIESTQTEFGFLGLFYGMIVVMILYNLFLYFSLRIRAYFFYVLAICSAMIGQLALNGLGFKYFWPIFPGWNVMAVPFWVSVSCIFILLFTKEFLDTTEYVPFFNKVCIVLIGLNGTTLLFLFISHNASLYLMLTSALFTFTSVLTVGFISLKKGVRQARFFILGWLVFLTGTFITILERAAILPYSLFTEYAGQGALSIEVVLLSLALADKINIMREEKAKAEQLARESQELALVNLQKADELKDEFLAITSHELRTPLYGMIGIAESLKEGAAGSVSREMENQLEMIRTSGKRLSHLVNDILDFSKLKHETLPIDVKKLNLWGLVDAVSIVCQPLLKDKQVRLLNNVPQNLRAVVADQDRLQQIMYNLIGNAIKYTDVGAVTVFAEEIDDYVKISIADTGKGIPVEMQKKVFEPFKQADHSLSRKVGGTGIGLTVTKQLVELHGGELTVKSEIGKGTVFSFVLPLSIDRKEKYLVPVTIETFVDNDITLTVPKLPLKDEAIKVLIADDELVNLQVLMNQLMLEGIDVMKVTNGKDVLKVVEKHVIDVLILDVMMPHLSGFEVCEQLRKKYTLLELPILMLTAKSQVRDKITAFSVGANDYVTKPCDKEELLSRVRTLAQLKQMNEKLTTLNVKLEEKVINRTKALKMANQDLTETNDMLRKMAKSRRNLLANIAHELGTPVMFIHSYVQALQDGLVTAEDIYYHHFVNEKVKVLDRLIDDLTDLSQLEEGRTSLNLEKIDVYGWLHSIYKKFAFDVRSYGRTVVKDELQITPGDFECLIDVERMDQVFVNLISNAVKNTDKEDGTLSLKTVVNMEETTLVISIEDNGNGIKEELLPYIFERFYQQLPVSEDEEQVGSGLGLSIVKEIIQGHNGSIWADSKLNEGTIFYISLPIQNAIEADEDEVNKR